ncbi:MAG: restriction endonuclease subunit S [Chthoniobacteraceae bacterium]
MAVNLDDLPLPDELPVIPNDWHYESLGDLVEERGVSYGIVQPGTETTNGVPIVRVNNIRNGRIDTTDMLKVESGVEAKFQRSRLRGGEVLLTLVGTLGEVAIVPQNLSGWNVARAVGVIPVRKDPGSLWVSICLRSAFLQHCIRTWATTTVQATFNLRDLAKLPIPVPPKRKREAISQVLGGLDDKIELNRRMNATLEAMARALFQSWFADFDPVRDKLDGRQPVGLDDATAALFPAHFQESTLGPIPQGWRACTLDEVIEISDSKRVPLSGRERALRHGQYPYHGAASVMDHVNDFRFDGIYVLMGEDGSVINDDGTPVLQYVWGKFWVNNHAHVLRGRNDVSTEHVLLHLKNCNIAPFVNGAVQLKLNQGNMNRIPFILPPPEISGIFAKIIEPFFAQIRANTEQSRTLAALRDTLLPKLLSGELSLKNLEKMAVA